MLLEKNGSERLAGSKVVTKLQLLLFFFKTVSVKYSKAKYQKKKKKKKKKKKRGVPVTSKNSFPFQALSFNFGTHHQRMWSLLTMITALYSPPCTYLITSHWRTSVFPLKDFIFPLFCIRELTFGSYWAMILLSYPVFSYVLWVLEYISPFSLHDHCFSTLILWAAARSSFS